MDGDENSLTSYRQMTRCRLNSDDHRGAFTGEGGGDLFADATGGGGNEGKFIVEMEIHGRFLLKKVVILYPA
jgi:hypothetical protein